MSEISSYLMIIASVAGIVFVFWLLDKWCEVENDERRRALRDLQREDKRRENAAWYAETRTEDNRADLFRFAADWRDGR